MAIAHWMGVDAAQTGQRKHPGQNEAPVGDNDDGIGRNGFGLRAKLRIVANRLRLRDGEADGQRGQLDGRP
jgi:hypothetical protein